MEFSGQYLEYDEYLELGGTLDMMPFNLLEFEARKKIDERTQGRLVGIEVVPEEVKLCVFALINTIDSYAGSSSSASNRHIASESTDGYSVSYVTGGQIAQVMISKNNELQDIIMTYLSRTIVNKIPVLYLGVC